MHPLDELVRAADPQPERHEVSPDVWRRVRTDIAAEASASGQPGRHLVGTSTWKQRLPRTPRQAAVAALIVAGLSGSGVAVAKTYLATRTGEKATVAWEISAGGPGEYLRMDGSDFSQVVRELSSDIPFPSEASRDVAIAGPKPGMKEADTLISEGAQRAELARYAICSWADEWAATRQSDPQRAAKAQKELKKAVNWPAVTAVDPNPSMDGYQGDRGKQPTVMGEMMPIRAAVLADDLPALQSTVEQRQWCLAPTPHIVSPR